MVFTPEIWVQSGMLLVTICALAYNSHKDGEKKRGRIYERIDEVKNGIAEAYVRKDVCSVVTDAMQRDVAEIKTDVKILLRMKQTNKG